VHHYLRVKRRKLGFFHQIILEKEQTTLSARFQARAGCMG